MHYRLHLADQYVPQSATIEHAALRVVGCLQPRGRIESGIINAGRTRLGMRAPQTGANICLTPQILLLIH